MLKLPLAFFVMMVFASSALAAERTVVVRPKEIDAVLVNPGIGFTTFGRFNGDPLHDSTDPAGYPASSVAYFRIYWDTIEPEQGHYRWDYIDDLLAKAREHGQTLMLRVGPYSSAKKESEASDNKNHDVPAWYRKLVGDDAATQPIAKWRTDPENPLYAKYYGALIRELGKRYDGNPDLESVDLAIVGAWGEGAGSERLSNTTRRALVDCYIESFKKTPLVAMLMDEKTNRYILSRGTAGWRADCLGDMGGFSPNHTQMQDSYPEATVRYHLTDAWMKAPVNFESCWVMSFWKQKEWDINYIIDQSLKWHMSSFNNKSSAVPKEWSAQVDRWLTHMGYRFVLRKFTYPANVSSGGKLAFTSWWENKGVAPIYHEFPLALKLQASDQSQLMLLDCDIRKWTPGDAICDGAVSVPSVPAGKYRLSIGLVDPATHKPRIRLANEGRDADGWYSLGDIQVAGSK